MGVIRVMSNIESAEGTLTDSEIMHNMDGILFRVYEDRIFSPTESLSYVFGEDPRNLITILHEIKISSKQANAIVESYCIERNFSEEQRKKVLSEFANISPTLS